MLPHIFFRPSASLSSFSLFSDVTTFSHAFNSLTAISSAKFGRRKAASVHFLSRQEGKASKNGGQHAMC